MAVPNNNTFYHQLDVMPSRADNSVDGEPYQATACPELRNLQYFASLQYDRGEAQLVAFLGPARTFLRPTGHLIHGQICPLPC
jgi:hypothetical protein